jgi:hypothetical protein
MKLLPNASTNCSPLQSVVDAGAPGLGVNGLHGVHKLKPIGGCGMVPGQLALHLIPVIRLLPVDILHYFPK